MIRPEILLVILIALVAISLEAVRLEPSEKSSENSTRAGNFIIILTPSDSNETSRMGAAKDQDMIATETLVVPLKQIEEAETLEPDQLDANEHQTSARYREARKVNLFSGGFWNKPRVSPLYLINGTVCRFVNSVPICTTLSTQGLLRKSPVHSPA